MDDLRRDLHPDGSRWPSRLEQRKIDHPLTPAQRRGAVRWTLALSIALLLVAALFFRLPAPAYVMGLIPLVFGLSLMLVAREIDRHG